MMNIYLVQRTDTIGCGEIEEMICRAGCKKEAKLLEPASNCRWNVWPSRNNLRVLYIGHCEHTNPEVVTYKVRVA
jgi:hypothetical protein